MAKAESLGLSWGLGSGGMHLILTPPPPGCVTFGQSLNLFEPLSVLRANVGCAQACLPSHWEYKLFCF